MAKLYTIFRIMIRIRRLRWQWWTFALLAILGYLGCQIYLFVDGQFMAAEELPFYEVGPRQENDTLKIVVIGDSWAEFHLKFGCDTLLEQYGARLTDKPIRSMSRGRGGAKSKEVYYDMFRNWNYDDSEACDNYCTQPLLEQHPDYCVVMVGINDTWKKRPISYYTGNYRLIIRLLLANHIRPVVMEIPDFEMGEWLDANRRRQRILYRFYSYFTGVVEDDITPFREGLKGMLKDTGLVDSVLFIPANHWLPENHQYSAEIYQEDHVHINNHGYHVLDSCIISEILNDYKAYGK